MLQSKKDPRRVFVAWKDHLSTIYYNKGKWIDEGRIDGIKDDCRGLIEDEEGNLMGEVFETREEAEQSIKELEAEELENG